LVDELVGSEGNGYNSESGIKHLMILLDSLSGDTRDGYNSESGRHTIYHFFHSLRFHINLLSAQQMNPYVILHDSTELLFAPSSSWLESSYIVIIECK
jgi:hypothetical protein